MRREHRLRRASDIERVRTGGKSWAHPLFVCVVRRRGDDAPNRFAVVTGRRLGNAVVRNRVRRRVREALRALEPKLLPGHDVLLIARPSAAESAYASVEATIALLTRRAGLQAAKSDGGVATGLADERPLPSTEGGADT